MSTAHELQTPIYIYICQLLVGYRRTYNAKEDSDALIQLDVEEEDAIRAQTKRKLEEATEGGKINLRHSCSRNIHNLR